MLSKGKLEMMEKTDLFLAVRRAAVALAVAGTVAVAALPAGCGRRGADDKEEAVQEKKLMYGIEYENYRVISDRVGSGQTLSHLLGGQGMKSADIDRVDRAVRPVFDMRGMRAGQPYALFMEKDSLGGEHIRHFVYEKNPIDYVAVTVGDSIIVAEGHKDVTVMRRRETATINSSLWNAVVAAGIPVSVSCDIENVFGSSVDFFSLQQGDSFTVIYDEQWIDTVRVGTGRIWGARFLHGGKEYTAIPFRQDGRISYWDENGNSMRRQFLKAPLSYTRISSRFSPSRMHPILKVRRPHYGVDYAAPAGTPVMAIADGVIVARHWDKGGGGNMLKIKHANGYISGYLHLRGYASGMNVGRHVSQGEVIAYVGSTGRSTGPHLDFRIWKNGTPIDPLKIPSDPVEPIADTNRMAFGYFRDRIIAELDGKITDEDRIRDLDYIPDSAALARPLVPVAADETDDAADE